MHLDPKAPDFLALALLSMVDRACRLGTVDNLKIVDRADHANPVFVGLGASYG